MSETLLNAAYSTSVSGLHAAGTAMQAMKQALEALENGGRIETNEAITALRLAIEQAEKQAALDRMADNARELGLDYEPVAWKDRTYGNLHHQDFGNSIPLYTTPPRREWVGLTDNEMRDLEKQFNAERVRTSDEEYLVIYPSDYWDWQRAIEAKLKEKNA